MPDSFHSRTTVANLPHVLVCALLITTGVDPAGAADRNRDAMPDPVALLQAYITVDTTNPPGNEARATDFLAGILEEAGVDYQVAESAPERANLWARLEGGDEPALLLLHHTDVVAADPAAWSAPPLAGNIVDGHIVGRGALDMKSHGIIHLIAFLELYRSGQTLDRDIIFMATADEEAGSAFGMGWMMEHRPDAFRDVGFVLTEGGAATLVGKQLAIGIEVTQKIPLWLRLTATGKPGHGSTPGPQSAVNSLLDALGRFRAHQFEPRIIAPVREYMHGLAPNFPGKMGNALKNIDESVLNKSFMDGLHGTLPNLYALTQNTCAITRLAGSSKVNVVSNTATAELDCRLLPDEDPDQFVSIVRAIIADPKIEIEKTLSYTASSSSTDTEFYAAITGVMSEHFPEARIGPSVSTGFTDSHWFREQGITSYGFSPFVIPVADIGGFHGNNERISADNMVNASALLVEILHRFVID